MPRPNPKNSFATGQDIGDFQFGLPEDINDTLLLTDEERKKKLMQRSPATSLLFGQNTLGDAAQQLFHAGVAGTALGGRRL